MMKQRLIHLLRLTAFAEGVSLILLVGVAMPLKYFANFPLAVNVVGMIHGVLFLAFCAGLFWAVTQASMSVMVALLGVLLAVVPTGTFFFDHKIAALQ